MTAEEAKPVRGQVQKRGRLWRTFVAWSVLAIAVGVAVTLVFAFLASGGWPWDTGNQLKSRGWFDVIRSALAALGLFGLGGAAVLAYRKQRTTESQHRLDSDIHTASRTADLRARYTSAAEQLGHEKPAVRLAGVYAMASLADDWSQEGNETERQVCIDVLCAYIRMPYEPARAPIGEKEVRLTIISVIRTHLRLGAKDEWQGCYFNLSGAIFDGGDFSHAWFGEYTKLNFRGAQFLPGAKVSFHMAHFAPLSEVDFNEALLYGHTEVSFEEAMFFGGEVSFRKAFFRGNVYFFSAGFADDAVVRFDEAIFSGGTVLFSNAGFRGGSVTFNHARFCGSNVKFHNISGATPGLLSFEEPWAWNPPPEVPWGTDSVPEWARPKEWPPAMPDDSSTPGMRDPEGQLGVFRRAARSISRLIRHDRRRRTLASRN